jgi:hypothetical protein
MLDVPIGVKHKCWPVRWLATDCMIRIPAHYYVLASIIRYYSELVYAHLTGGGPEGGVA